MTTLNYTSTAGDPALDAAFEARARNGARGTPGAARAPDRRPLGGRRRAVRARRSVRPLAGRRARASRLAGGRRRSRRRRPRRPARPGPPRRWPSAPPRCAGSPTLIGERAVELGAIVSAETGKVRLESVPEVQEGVDLIEAYCGHMERNDGYVIPLGQLSDDEHNTSLMLPYGVFAVICPFNFPFALAVGMSTGALVTGNTVVMKPAEETPWSTGADRRAGRRGGPAARRPQRRPGRRRDRPRAGRRRTSTASPSPARPRPATRSPAPCTRRGRCAR